MNAGRETRITALQAAREYRARGWWPIPIRPREKAPSVTDWPNLRLSEQDLPAHFPDCTNVGLLLGEPSSLIDMDLDLREAAITARYLLPATDRVHGRRSAPRSHLWFIARPTPAPQKFTDLDENQKVGGSNPSGRATHFLALSPLSVNFRLSAPTANLRRKGQKGTQISGTCSGSPPATLSATPRGRS